MAPVSVAVIVFFSWAGAVVGILLGIGIEKVYIRYKIEGGR